MTQLKAIIFMILWTSHVNAQTSPNSLECQGCHFEEREKPTAFFGNGLGKWEDRNCVGCHQESNEIGKNLAEGKEDKRYYGLPLRREKLLSLKDHPLPYQGAPKQAFHREASIQRMDLNDVYSYIKNPVRSPYRDPRDREMMAFPDFKFEELKSLFLTKGGSSEHSPIGGSVEHGKALWESQCQSCHSMNETTAIPSGFYLSHLSGQWIHGYANGKVENPYKKRTMPLKSISQEEASAIKAYLTEEKLSAIASLDQQIQKLTLPSQQLSERRKLKPQTISWILDKMPRAASCVHCHDGQQRPAQRFQATRAGMIDYLQNQGAQKLITRIKTRELEWKAGVTATQTGMPMTMPPLPGELVQLLEAWILQNCPLEDGTEVCREKK